MSESKDGKSLPKLVAVKTEGGVAKAPATEKRLPSFTKRDLTLGGGSTSRAVALALTGNRGRKTYAPNLNVQRSNIKEEPKSRVETTKLKPAARGRGRGAADRSRSSRGRGRESNLIQLSNGVFSEGIAPVPVKRSSRYEHDDKTPASYVPKPSLNLKQNYSADALEEGERYKQLLNDKFIDDPDAITDRVKPLQLPMIPFKKGAQTPVAGGVMVKKEKQDPELSPESSLPDKQSVVKIKREPVETGGPESKPLLKGDEWNLYDRHVGDIFVSREPEYILIQLPDCLPGLRPTTESENGKASSSSAAPQESASEAAPRPQCTLSTLPEGLMGKIQLLRSGRARLQLGAVTLPISMGTQVAFRQDLISMNLNDLHKNGKMVNLGQVRTRLVMTPDWETLLRKV